MPTLNGGHFFWLGLRLESRPAMRALFIYVRRSVSLLCRDSGDLLGDELPLATPFPPYIHKTVVPADVLSLGAGGRPHVALNRRTIDHYGYGWVHQMHSHGILVVRLDLCHAGDHSVDV